MVSQVEKVSSGELGGDEGIGRGESDCDTQDDDNLRILDMAGL